MIHESEHIPGADSETRTSVRVLRTNPELWVLLSVPHLRGNILLCAQPQEMRPQAGQAFAARCTSAKGLDSREQGNGQPEHALWYSIGPNDSLKMHCRMLSALKREIRSSKAPNPAGPYSQAIDAGVIYCAGQIGIDPSTGELETGIAGQTRRVMSNLREVLRSAGMDFTNVVKTTVILTDMSEYSQMNEEYGKCFFAPFPARTTLQAAALPRGARVEIDAIAVR